MVPERGQKMQGISLHAFPNLQFIGYVVSVDYWINELLDYVVSVEVVN